MTLITLFGENSYMINKRVEAILKDIHAMDITVLEEPDINTLVDAITLSPLRGGRRYVVVKSLEAIPNSKKAVNVIEKRNNNTVIIFKLASLTGRAVIKKHLKTGYKFREINKMTLKSARGYAQEKAEGLGLKLSGFTLDYFLGLTGNDASVIDLELKVIKSGFAEEVVTKAAIDASVHDRKELMIFTVVNACFIDLAKGFELIHQRLLTPKNATPALLGLFLHKAKYGLILRSTEDVSTLDIAPFVRQTVLLSTKNFTTDKLAGFFDVLAELQTAYITTGRDVMPRLIQALVRLHN